MSNWEQQIKTFEYAIKWKAAIIKRELLRAKAKCPYCEHGFWHGTLNGPKKHLHMSCDGCSTMMME